MKNILYSSVQLLKITDIISPLKDFWGADFHIAE